jgi:hypothetical protein
MRTTGSLVDVGHARRYAACRGRLRSSGGGPAAAQSCRTLAILTLKCQRLASSSRNQVQPGTTSAAALLTWDRPSVSVRWRPPLSVAIVTHLVTRLADLGLPGEDICAAPRREPDRLSEPG